MSNNDNNHDIETAYKEGGFATEILTSHSTSSNGSGLSSSDALSPLGGATAAAAERNSHTHTLLTGTMTDSSSSAGAPATIVSPPRPKVATRQLTETSQKYDRGNKGYLDDTEQALRRMDSNNQGFLDNNKVFEIMQSLQEEQKRSAALMDTLQQESKNSLQLKRSLVVMIGFALLLAVANIGVSFAAARLSKDTRIQDYTGDLMVLGTSERVGTTSKDVYVAVIPYVGTNETSRRRLQRELATQTVCSRISGTMANCEIQGEIDVTAATTLYQQLCPNWSVQNDFVSTGTCGGGVSSVNMQCTGKTSQVLGGMFLPATSPTVDAATGDIAFPTKGGSYVARQAVGCSCQPSCVQEYSMGMYCYKGDPTCLVFAAWDGVDQCGSAIPTAVAVCG